MKICIHQPNYLPGISYFSKMLLGDVHIFLDDVEYSKGDFINRNKICVNSHAIFLTVPVSKKHSHSKINIIPLPVEDKWKNKHISTITQNYKKCRFFKDFSGPILGSIEKCNDSLHSLNIQLIKTIASLLGIHPQFKQSSLLNINPDLTAGERLAALVKKVNGTEYISGLGAKAYMDESPFKKAGVGVSWKGYQPTPYQQSSEKFIENLSIIDLLFNEGASSINYL